MLLRHNEKINMQFSLSVHSCCYEAHQSFATASDMRKILL